MHIKFKFEACTSQQLDVMSTQSSAVAVRMLNMSSDLIKNSAERGPSAVIHGLVKHKLGE